MRLVLDNNIFVSALLSRNSRLARRVFDILAAHEVVHSNAMIEELTEALARPKLVRLITRDEAEAFIEVLRTTTEEVRVVHRVVACRDPKDDKVLALALSAKADCIVTGDQDLLTLNPFRGVPILTVAQFVSQPPDHSP